MVLQTLPQSGCKSVTMCILTQHTLSQKKKRIHSPCLTLTSKMHSVSETVTPIANVSKQKKILEKASTLVIEDEEDDENDDVDIEDDQEDLVGPEDLQNESNEFPPITVPLFRLMKEIDLADAIGLLENDIQACLQKMKEIDLVENDLLAERIQLNMEFVYEKWPLELKCYVSEDNDWYSIVEKLWPRDNAMAIYLLSNPINHNSFGKDELRIFQKAWQCLQCRHDKVVFAFSKEMLYSQAQQILKLAFCFGF